MNLLLLSEANLRDRVFMRDFVHSYAFQTKSIIVHPFAGSEADTRSITKRVSWLLSEVLVHNVAFCADQRSIFRQTASGDFLVDVPKIEQLIAPVKALVLGALMKNAAGETAPADALQLLAQLRASYPQAAVYVFPQNPLSAMAQQKQHIATDADAARLLALYEEEAATIENARKLAPATIASAVNYAL